MAKYKLAGSAGNWKPPEEHRCRVCGEIANFCGDQSWFCTVHWMLSIHGTEMMIQRAKRVNGVDEDHDD